MAQPVEHAQAHQIGLEFCVAYYKAFDSDRSMMGSFYHPTLSVMTFEGFRCQGGEAIISKLVNLPFRIVSHATTAVDCHYTIDNSLLVAVLGQLQTDEDPKQPFHQTFVLKQVGQSILITNDIFRLGIHNF